jgi:hypothetical protein
MLDPKRREFIALLGGGGLLLAAKVKRARAQQPKMLRVGYSGMLPRLTSRDELFPARRRCIR